MSDPTVERKPLNKLAVIALKQLNEKFAGAVQEIIAAAADVDGIDATAGWQFDPQSQSWVRTVADPR